MVSRKLTVLAVVVLCALMCSMAGAQQRQPGGRGPGGPGGRGFGGPGGGGFGGVNVAQTMVSLLDIEKVKKDLDVLPEQIADIKKYLEEQQNNRPQIDFQGFRNLSEEERAKRMAELQKDREKRAKEMKAKLGEYLLPHQADRLEEIALQILGVNALNDAEVAASLKISADQKKKIEEVQTKGREEMFAKMRESFQAGGGGNVDRDAMRKQFEDFRKEQDGKVLAVLTSAQKADWEKMKGKTLELTDEDRAAMRGGRGFGGRGGPGGGPGGPGGRGGAPGQGRPGRPARPGGNNNN